MSVLFSKGNVLKQRGFGMSDMEGEDEVLNNIVDLGDFSHVVRRNSDKEANGSEFERNKGSLLRLFQSDVFDAHLHLYYMYHHKEFGVHEYLVNLLYDRSDEILWYLPQLCEISLNRFKNSSLWKYFLDKSSENMNFSLILSWMYQAMNEDNLPSVSENAQNMLQEIEMAVVNSKLKPDIRYIEKRLCSWRKSKTCIFNPSNTQDFKYCENFDSVEQKESNKEDEYAFRDNTKTQLSLAVYSTLPSSETINLTAEEMVTDQRELLSNINIQSSTPSENQLISKSRPIELSSCDILPDIWIYRIITDDFSIENKRKLDYIQSKLGMINRQFKNLYSNASSAAYYNPNPGTTSSNEGSSNPFGSFNQSLLQVGMISGSSPFGIYNFSFNSNKVSIPYFFFSKLGSPFDLINVNKIINDIQLRSKSRIKLLQKSSELARQAEDNLTPRTPVSVIRITHPFSPSSDSDNSDGESMISDNLELISETPNQSEEEFASPSDNVDTCSPIHIDNDILQNEEIFNVYISEIEKESETLYYLLKQHRCNYFNRVNQLVSQFLEISTFLQTNVNKEHRCEILEFIIEELNLWLFYSRFSISISRTTFLLNGLSLPMSLFNNEFCRRFSNSEHEFTGNNEKFGSNESRLGPSYSHTSNRSLSSLNNCQFLRIIPSECKVYNSRKRVHFLLAIEIADLDDRDHEPGKECQKMVSEDVLRYLKNHGIKLKDSREESHDVLLNFLNILSIGISDSGDLGLSQEDFEQVAFIENKDTEGTESCEDPTPNYTEDLEDDEYKNDDWPQETWSNKIKRLKRESPYSTLKSWGIRTLLLKSSDDLRQEFLASQLLQQFDWIFKNSNLPLWLYPCEILVIGSHGGFIEYIQDTFSIDSLKRRFQTDNLLHCFEKLFSKDEIRTKARKCFIESHAAYSLVSYFLQVKDRHNGNFLIDKFGHIIQIDYGFMLSNSPGNVNFEQSPFKLTQEFLDVMLGENSEEFQYFQQLIIKGFLASRKYVDQIILTIESMTSASKLPCFSIFTNKEYFIQEIKDRFFIHLTEEQCVFKVTELIQSSINNWRSIQYDAFQRITNGIL
ncbi:phosphatidylinositol 4-kinase [Cryptosporidium felis]|nr:phosphatidylinositol 4-kinase [Cryptosporidium felis]